MEKLTNAEMRKLKAQAQHLEPMFKVGKAGLSEPFLKTVDDGLARRELVKIKFVEFKEEKKTLAPQLAEKTSSHLITRVGNVVVLYRPKPALPAAVAASPAPTAPKH
jgi:RNA-binding protein